MPALVEVEIPGYYGSGIVTTDSEGQEVVITAAHVTKNTPLNEITIVDAQKHEEHPTGGCYMYENDGKFLPATYEHSGTYDIAVLKLTGAIGKDALKLAVDSPPRGDWVFFKNYQMWAALKRPRTYAGMVIKSDSKHLDFDVLTGLQYWRKNNYVIRGGASGGRVVDEKGRLVGMSVASPGVLYQGEGWLKTMDNVKIDGTKIGRESGLMPLEADVIHADAIETALSSPRA